MRWLIVEDALQDSRGHWFEYARVFHNELIRLGDGVEILVSKKAESRIIQKLNARAILPDSIWHKLDQQTLLARIISVPLHAFRTWLALSLYSNGICTSSIGLVCSHSNNPQKKSRTHLIIFCQHSHDRR